MSPPDRRVRGVNGSTIGWDTKSDGQAAHTLAGKSVALVISELRPGGAERVIVHLTKGFSQRGIQPTVICLQSRGALAEEAEGNGARLYALESHRSYDLRAIHRLSRILRSVRPAVVNVHDYASLPYVAIANVMGGRRPIVFTAHGLLYEGFDSLRVRHRLAARCLSGLTAVTEAVGQRHREYLNWSTSIYVLPNGVETLKRSEGARQRLREELGISPDSFVFLAVGNARPEKGFEDLLAAMKWLTRRDPARTCLCLVAGKVGDDDYGRLLRDQRHAQNLTEKVRFLGFRSDARELYSAADAFVLSSRSEGLPMVILEAMMAELPVVATNVGGVGDVVTADTGELAAPRDPQDLGAAMRAIMNVPRRARELGRAGRRRAVAEYSVERMCDRYIELFSTVIRRREGVRE